MTGSTDPAAIGGVGLGAIPKQRRGIEMRDRLYEAAIAEFTAVGIEDSRVENIVAEAGTSWGTFFRYFPRKEDVLLHAAAKHYREHVRPVFEHGLDDPSRTVESVAREVFAKLTKPDLAPRLHAEVLAEAQLAPIRFSAIVGEGELPLIVRTAQLLEVGRQRGEVRDDAPAMVSAFVLAAGVFFSTTQVIRGVASGELPGAEIARMAEQAFDVAWSGVGT